MGISEPIVTQIEAFDGRGIHVGYAQMLANGRWEVTFTGDKDRQWVDAEHEATNLLEERGAMTFTYNGPGGQLPF